MNMIPTEILDFSPPVGLGVGLLMLGFFLKRSPLADWLIPLLIMVTGAAIYPFIAEIGKVSATITNPNLYNAVIGAGIGGLVTGGHQAVKQFLKDRKGDTTFTKKPEEPKS